MVFNFRKTFNWRPNMSTRKKKKDERPGKIVCLKYVTHNEFDSDYQTNSTLTRNKLQSDKLRNDEPPPLRPRKVISIDQVKLPDKPNPVEIKKTPPLPEEPVKEKPQITQNEIIEKVINDNTISKDDKVDNKTPNELEIEEKAVKSILKRSPENAPPQTPEDEKPKSITFAEIVEVDETSESESEDEEQMRAMKKIVTRSNKSKPSFEDKMYSSAAASIFFDEEEPEVEERVRRIAYGDDDGEGDSQTSA